MNYLYPQGKTKALTFSYDDGQVFDRRLVEIFNKYGVKATFHLNSGTLGGGIFISPDEVKTLFEGHEVSCHGVEHKNLPSIPRPLVMAELAEDRKALEKLSGGLVQGMSYAFGNYNAEIKEIAKSAGIKYSRTVNDMFGFFPPADFLEWHPTCHHDKRLMELGQNFLNMPPFIELGLMYVWGHSFEFDRNNNWEHIEEFVKMMSGKDDIWYATNLEICDYINATRSQEFSADGTTIHNPTAITIWLRTGEGVVELKPGETKYIGK